MELRFFNQFINKIFHTLTRSDNNSFLKSMIKLIKALYNVDNIIIRNFRNEIIRVFFTNIHWWKISHSSYNQVEHQFINYIREYISYPKIILELGSLDAIQSIEFSILFPKAQIFAFECNPSSIKKCLENTANLKNIEVVPKAVHNKNERVKFYPVVTNIGASSLYKVSSNYRTIETLIQEEISVEATRIDTWASDKGINQIDLCWMDLQGAEYYVLEGMGDLLFTVQAIYLEVEHQELYNNQKLYEDIIEFLKQKNFSLIKYLPTKPSWWGNAIFLNNNLKK